MDRVKLEPPSAAEAPGVFKPSEAVPSLRRGRLWRAAAGMALAIAIGSAMVAAEFALELSRRTDYYNRRVASLNSSLRDLRRQDSADRRKLGVANGQANQNQLAERLLFSPGLRIVKLAAPNSKPSMWGPAGAGPAGMLAISEDAGLAMLDTTGLSPTGSHEVYRVWWAPRHGAVVWAADFIVGEDGHARLSLEFPSTRRDLSSVEISREYENYAEAPSSPIVLSGHLGK